MEMMERLQRENIAVSIRLDREESRSKYRGNRDRDRTSDIGEIKTGADFRARLL